jgi:hypothetical protein
MPRALCPPHTDMNFMNSQLVLNVDLDTNGVQRRRVNHLIFKHGLMVENCMSTMMWHNLTGGPPDCFQSTT